jgi:PhnB protein
MSPNAYLQFDGRCAEALAFYAEALGGRIEMMSKYSEAPPNAQMQPVPEHWIMHGRISWPNGGLLMGSDGGPTAFAGYQGFSLSVNCASVEQGRSAFERLAVGGQVRLPFGPTFWGPGFGMLVDRFGVGWMVNVDQPPT